jgi:hypothetical protein
MKIFFRIDEDRTFKLLTLLPNHPWLVFFQGFILFITSMSTDE